MRLMYSILISVIMIVTGQTLLKQGLGNVTLEVSMNSLISLAYEPLIWIGLILIGLSSIIWLSILSKAEISYAYPMISLGYVLTALIGSVYLNEHVSPLRWAGIFTICFGVFLMSKS